MLLNIFRVTTDDKELAKAVQAALLNALFASKLSLVIGAALGAALSALIGYATGDRWLITCGVLLTLAGVSRTISFGMFHKRTDKNAATWEVIYHLGAWVYAALLGQLTLLTFFRSDDLSLQLLAATLSTAYSAGAAGRNTGRPMIAVGQLLLCAAPLSVALLFHPSPVNLLLALSNLLFILVMIDITLQTYKTVLTAFIDRQEKLRLATVYERLSRTDPLTGIDNRVTLKANLETMLQDGRSLVAVIWMDLDRFKQINDTLGHAAGDVVLHAVAARLKELAGTSGVLGRFGGDEFIMVLPVADVEAAIAFGEKVRQKLNEPEDADGISVDFSASIGVSVSEHGIQSADTLLRYADVALYEAKARGRNCVVVFDPEMEERLLQSKQIENDLKRAIANEELELYFQPIVDLKTGRVKSFEALLRWHHPVHGNIPPDTFIPIAEATHSIDAITEWVIDCACAQAALWPDHVSVCINISPAVLKARKLLPMVVEALLAYELPARRLELEITETALVEDNTNIRVVLEGFQRLGIRLSLDDFGTGFSSLSYLCRYSFDVIKIDRSFTADIYRSSEARAVVQAISTLGYSLNLTVVAEGIETVQQLDYIRNQGCAEGQGYYFSRPVPAAMTFEMLEKCYFDPNIPPIDTQRLTELPPPPHDASSTPAPRRAGASS